MAFPGHYLLQWGGDFVSEPAEIWSNNIRFCVSENTSEDDPPAMTPAQQQAMATAALTVLNTHVANAPALCGSNTRFKFVKFNRIDEDGTYFDATSTNAAFAAGSGTVGTGDPTHPITAAMVVSWVTAASRGPASRGRIFVPHPNVTTAGPTYRISSGTGGAAATAYLNLLNSLNNAITTAGGTGGLKACVVSNVGLGLARAITNAQIGNFLDYMGSRRNNLTEVRFTSAAVT